MEFPKLLKPPESRKSNEFPVNVPDPMLLYNAIGSINRKEDLQLGESHSEDELFSQIKSKARLNSRNNYSIAVELIYQNQVNQYWPEEQKTKLIKLLNNKGNNVNVGEDNKY